METQKRRLLRSRTNKMIAGVCGGIADWLRWDPTMVRVGYVLLSIVSAAFPGILVYILLWLVAPLAEAEAEPASPGSP
jgi:phage shock protein C